MDQATRKIEDYGFIGNMRTAALIDRDASISWLCLPRFDSDACCAALLGDENNGHWCIQPSEAVRSRSRRYRGETLVLETLFETAQGSVAVIDFMPVASKGDNEEDVMRIVEGRSGCVPMRCHAAFRFGYGRLMPWLSQDEDCISAVAGPDGLRMAAPIGLETRGSDIIASFEVRAGEQVPFVLTWYTPFRNVPSHRDALRSLEETECWWREWSSRCQVADRYREPVVRSLITLKALTHIETGGMVGAPTTSLPEQPGAGLNWDYRYTWLRDATFTLYALLSSGYRDEAYAWREWLLRAVAGDPGKLQPLYGLAGERRLYEHEIEWLEGFNGCRPVRIGNDAFRQNQLDVYGEVMDGLHLARVHHIEPSHNMWDIQCKMIDFLEQHWSEKGAGLWESREPPRHYTHSKVMAWVAVDRVIKGAEHFGLDGDVQRWRALRQRIHDDVCTHGFNRERNSFVQSYGADALDASLLLLPQVGFLPIEDPRILGTIEAIQAELVHDGFVYRYSHGDEDRHLTEGEGAFLVCSFWLVDTLELLGRHDEARDLFDKLLSVRNDLGLLAEEYHPIARCQLGNFPQAFSHVGLINSAHNLSKDMPDHKGPAQERSDEGR
ncbi:glycoside hydrolase family 15 protein [Billgrantia bachuensis]